MDILTILGVIGIVVGIIAGTVQVIEYLQKRRQQREDEQTKPQLSTLPQVDETELANLAQLRRQLTSLFNESELRSIAFDLGVDYEILPGDSKEDTARELVEYIQRHGRLPKLVHRCRQMRPQAAWPTLWSSARQEIDLPVPKILHNLPRRSSFVGREAEKAQIHAALLDPATYLIGIDGIGGIGKSSLSLEVAYNCLESSLGNGGEAQIARFAGFIWTSAKDRELTLNVLLDTIVLTLDYPGIAQQPLEQKRSSVERLLRSNHYLLIVDNFETVSDAQLIDFVRTLPPPAKALITTREQNLHWTRVVSLKGLTEAETLTLIREEGRRLGLSGIENADDQLLHPLYETTEGAPLVIRWAIGQIKQKGQTLEIVVRSLREARSDIFEMIFSRSWQLLSPDARLVLLTMPFFASPAHRDAIKAATDLQEFTVDEAIGQNVEMWLVEPTSSVEQEERRYAIHPLTRYYANKRLHKNLVKEQRIWERIAKYYQEFAGQNGEFWSFEGYKRLEPELSNLLNIIRLAQKREQNLIATTIFLQIVTYMIVHGYWNDAMNIAKEILEAAEIAGDDLSRARLMVGPVGWLHRHRGQLQQAKDETLWGIPIVEESNDRRYAAYGRRNLGRIYQELGDYEMAEQMLEKSLVYFRETDNKHDIYFVTTNLADLALERGELEEAWRLCEEILPGAYQLDVPERIAAVLNVMGKVALVQGRRHEAKDLWEEALIHVKRVRRLDEIAFVQFHLAKLQYLDGNLDAVRILLNESLETFRKLGMEKEAQEVELFIKSSL